MTKRKVSKDEFIEVTADYMDGFFSEWDEALSDSPDGAWFETMENAAELILDEVSDHYNVEKPIDIDGNDLVHSWIKRVGTDVTPT